MYKNFPVQNPYRYTSASVNLTKKREIEWRRGWDSNPRMEVLQTSPLGLLGTAPTQCSQYIQNGLTMSVGAQF